uniref:Uncharacterized protein n=1 Tax=Oryza rufipogon TaxID=4529 RepID=A0A0E0PUV4_ORYRU
MGTREVYEEKLRSGAHLHRDPTMNPGLGSARCPRCLSLLTPNSSGEGDWAITSVLHDATAVVPPLLLFSGTSALFGAYALPTFAQLTVTSYYAASSASHYAVSQITRQIERSHLSDTNGNSR